MLNGRPGCLACRYDLPDTEVQKYICIPGGGTIPRVLREKED